MATNDFDTMIDMLSYAEIDFEVDEETYAPQIKVIRIVKFDPTNGGKKKIVAIFDFFNTGGLRRVD